MHTGLVRSGISDSEERREREDRSLETRGISPERVASLALDRLLANPSRILIGFDYRVLDLVARLSPGLAEQSMQLGAMRAKF
jgi:short-subunit dehydrogenase